MKKLFSIALFAILAVATQAQTVDDIISKHIAAMGGANWEKVKTLKMDIKMTAQAAAGMEIPISMTVVDKKSMRRDISLMGMTASECISGNTGWSSNPFQGKPDPEPMTDDQVSEGKDETDIAGHLYNYKAKGYTAEYLGTEDLEGTEVHKVKLVISPTKTQYSYFDPETFYEIKSTKIITIDGKEVKIEASASNFKTIDGVVFAHTVEATNPMMGPTVMTITNITVNPPVDETMFNMPAKK
jgi:Outer membrane lipoprotein-sorting protein